MRLRAVDPVTELAVAVGVAQAVLLTGCLAPPSALAKAQQTAQEFNLDTRFGRNALVMDKVAPTEREQYALHHRAWGTGVRVADVELTGMKAKGDHEVDVLVLVAWYRPEEQELKRTTLNQRWHEEGGSWQLAGERRVDGDPGLLGEAIVVEAPATPRAPAQFPTVRLDGRTME